MSLPYFLELLINGALSGLMYGVVGLGIVLIYKSSGVANLAQGAMVLLGGYLVWMFAAMGIPTYAAIAVAAVAMFMFGLLAERLLLRKMVGQPIIMVVMLTLGLDIFLRGFAPGVFGTTNKTLDMGISLAPLIVENIFINRAYIVGAIIAVVLIVLSIVFFRTRLGTKLRAVSDDHVASWSVGISVEHAVGISWGLAGVCAVGAASAWGSVQGINWTLSSLLFPAIAVVILGGLDSILGALVGGLILGILGSVIPAFLDQWVGGSSEKAVTSVLILLTILIRPYGLFGREDIERI